MNNTDKGKVILSVKNLKQYFNIGVGKNKLVVKAVDDVSFDVYEGEVFGLVGESGCGKTTTGRTAIKIYKPTDGEIHFLGEKIAAGTLTHKENIKKFKKDAYSKISEIKKKQNLDLEELRNKNLDGEKISKIKESYHNEISKIREEKQTKINAEKLAIKEKNKLNDNVDKETMKKMQMIFQDPIASINPRMTVKEIIAEGLKIAGEKDKELITKKVNEALVTVGLRAEHSNRYPHEFSGGQRQRIGIARALIVNPEFIIADEPISALDVSIQAQVINLMNDLKQNLNLTILFIAHDLSVVKYFSDRIGVMYYGKLVELATTEELFKNPLHPYTKSLLSAVPVPDPYLEKRRKRIIYDPKSHNYEVDAPSFREIKEGHFIFANDEEIEKYKKELV